MMKSYRPIYERKKGGEEVKLMLREKVLQKKVFAKKS